LAPDNDRWQVFQVAKDRLRHRIGSRQLDFTRDSQAGSLASKAPLIHNDACAAQQIGRSRFLFDLDFGDSVCSHTVLPAFWAKQIFFPVAGACA
jgi:hypothetical protein